MSYPPPLTATLSGASVRQLAYWRKQSPGRPALLEPEHGRRPRVLYSFRDVVALRMFVRLRGELSLQRLRKAAGWLVDAYPEVHISSHEVRALRDGRTAVWLSPSGEYVDIVEHPGQRGFELVIDDIFGPFTTPSGREVPDLGEPRPGITIDPDVRSGFPVIEGTRIPFSVVASLRRDGLSPAEVVEIYPSVTVAEVDGAEALADLVAISSGRAVAA